MSASSQASSKEQSPVLDMLNSKTNASTGHYLQTRSPFLCCLPMDVYSVVNSEEHY